MVDLVAELAAANKEVLRFDVVVHPVDDPQHLIIDHQNRLQRELVFESLEKVFERRPNWSIARIR